MSLDVTLGTFVYRDLCSAALQCYQRIDNNIRQLGIAIHTSDTNDLLVVLLCEVDHQHYHLGIITPRINV
jgi:hypothetical protein